MRRRWTGTYIALVIIPPDGTTINITKGFNIWITGVYYLWSSIGVLVSVAFGILNLVFRERKSVTGMHH